MNKNNVLLTALMTVFSINTVLPNTVYTQQTVEQQATLIISDADNKKPNWSNLCKTYASSLVSGGLIGSITGTLSGAAIIRASKTFLTDKEANCPPLFFLTAILTLFAEHNLRNRLIAGFNESCSENSIPHKKQLTYDTAWVASWIGFLIAP